MADPMGHRACDPRCPDRASEPAVLFLRGRNQAASGRHLSDRLCGCGPVGRSVGPIRPSTLPNTKAGTRPRSIPMRWAQRRVGAAKLEWQLRECTVPGRFAIAYRHPVDARSGEGVGYEALLRLNDEAGMPSHPLNSFPWPRKLTRSERSGNRCAFTR